MKHCTADEMRSHYDSVIAKVGQDYLKLRWFSNPVARAHYRHTLRAIRHCFSAIGDLGEVLEIGSGPGTWTNEFIQRSKSVTLFDISREFLNLVREKYKDEKKCVSFVLGDFIADVTCLGDRMFDTIFSGRALEYMSDKVVFVRNSYERLRSGGRLIVITKNPRWRDKVRNGDHGIHRGQVHWYDLKNILAEKGFVDVEIRPAAIGSYYPPFNNGIAALMSDIPFSWMMRRSMKLSFDFICESYIVEAHKP